MSEFTETIADGDDRAQLEALRDKLATAMDEADKGADIAALTRRLLDVLAKLKSIPDGKQKSAYDELAAKRVGGDKTAARLQGGRRRRKGSG